VFVGCCDEKVSQAQIEKANATQSRLNVIMTTQLAADSATIKLTQQNVCGTVQTDATFRKAGTADDGKEHYATFSGDKLKYVDGQPYIAPLEATN
jgi:hypothetical protein